MERKNLQVAIRAFGSLLVFLIALPFVLAILSTLVANIVGLPFALLAAFLVCLPITICYWLFHKIEAILPRDAISRILKIESEPESQNFGGCLILAFFGVLLLFPWMIPQNSLSLAILLIGAMLLVCGTALFLHYIWWYFLWKPRRRA
jgi:hypothetical protein